MSSRLESEPAEGEPALDQVRTPRVVGLGGREEDFAIEQLLDGESPIGLKVRPEDVGEVSEVLLDELINRSHVELSHPAHRFSPVELVVDARRLRLLVPQRFDEKLRGLARLDGAEDVCGLASDERRRGVRVGRLSGNP